MWGMERGALCSGDVIPSQLGCFLRSLRQYIQRCAWLVSNQSLSYCVFGVPKETFSVRKSTDLTDWWSLPSFPLGLIFATMFIRERAATLSEGSAAGGGNGCAGSNPPRGYVIAHRACVNGRRDSAPPWKFLPPTSLSWIKTQLKYMILSP